MSKIEEYQMKPEEVPEVWLYKPEKEEGYCRICELRKQVKVHP